jgi:hypothetical protein
VLRLEEPLTEPGRPGKEGVLNEVRRDEAGGGSDAPELLRDKGIGGIGGAGASSGTGGIEDDGE